MSPGLETHSVDVLPCRARARRPPDTTRIRSSSNAQCVPSVPSPPPRQLGLYGVPGLHAPQDFGALAQDAAARRVNDLCALLQHAASACVKLHALVGELSGHSGLYEALCRAQAQCRLPEEAVRVAASLRSEFERGGIHLPAAARAALQTEQARAVEAGHAWGFSTITDIGCT